MHRHINLAALGAGAGSGAGLAPCPASARLLACEKRGDQSADAVFDVGIRGMPALTLHVVCNRASCHEVRGFLNGAAIPTTGHGRRGLPQCSLNQIFL